MLISVIIPVYKVEAYLDECLASVVNQTYTDLEIICVNDDSPDRCPEMLAEWAKKDSRIKVVHRKNGGLSAARNTGLEHATGEYVAFVDSDDFVERQWLEVFVKTIESVGPLDVYQFQAYCIDDATSEIRKRTKNEHTLEGFYTFTTEQRYHALFNAYVTAWSKICRRAFLEQHNLRFVPGVYFEDNIFWVALALKAETMFFNNDSFYHYRYNRKSSIINDLNLGKELSIIRVIKEINTLLLSDSKNYSRFYTQILSHFIDLAWFRWSCNIHALDYSPYAKRKMMYELKRVFVSLNLSAFKRSNISSLRQLRLFMFFMYLSLPFHSTAIEDLLLHCNMYQNDKGVYVTIKLNKLKLRLKLLSIKKKQLSSV